MGNLKKKKATTKKKKNTLLVCAGRETSWRHLRVALGTWSRKESTQADPKETAKLGQVA